MVKVLINLTCFHVLLSWLFAFGITPVFGQRRTDNISAYIQQGFDDIILIAVLDQADADQCSQAMGKCPHFPQEYVPLAVR